MIRESAADFIGASSHTVLLEQAEHMDAPDRCSSLHKRSCAAGGAHPWTYNGRTVTQLRSRRGRPRHHVSYAWADRRNDLVIQQDVFEKRIVELNGKFYGGMCSDRLGLELFDGGGCLGRGIASGEWA